MSTGERCCAREFWVIATTIDALFGIGVARGATGPDARQGSAAAAGHNSLRLGTGDLSWRSRPRLPHRRFPPPPPPLPRPAPSPAASRPARAPPGCRAACCLGTRLCPLCCPPCAPSRPSSPSWALPPHRMRTTRRRPTAVATAQPAALRRLRCPRRWRRRQRCRRWHHQELAPSRARWCWAAMTTRCRRRLRPRWGATTKRCHQRLRPRWGATTKRCRRRLRPRRAAKMAPGRRQRRRRRYHRPRWQGGSPAWSA